MQTVWVGVKHELVVAVGGAVFSRFSGAAAVNALGFDAVDGMGMALVDEPSGTSGVDKVCVTGDAVVLGVIVALAVVGAANNDGMGQVATDEVNEDVLSVTQRLGVSHVITD
nr:hypothetical protein [Psychrobacter sp. ENNN9_III]